ncbi:mitochondrial ribosomal subunit protein-domain-containing protein [Nemania diffusa]|nr:mitochondrial ribosomal subunit protein-domain-containing protein [Nemania diffusa]
MASAVQSMRLCLRAASRRAATRATIAPRQRRLTIRSFSSTPFQHRPAARKDDRDEEFDDEMDEDVEREEIDPAEVQRALEESRRDPDYRNSEPIMERAINGLNSTFSEVSRPPKKQSALFWGDEEPDTDLLSEELNADKFDEDDIMSLAHGKLEEFREYREYARIAAWQMPLLSKLATPFEPPTDQEPLRFRYTSYMGELHPAEKKVVVEFCPQDLPLDEVQQQKLRKLLGPRWNPETDIAKMSCEQFDHQAQNKRYLGDLVTKLVEAARDPSDTFEDVPLDTRHHTFKVKPRFPEAWRMTEERRLFLEDTRQKSLLLDQAKEEAGTLVNGEERIELFFNPPPEHKVREMATARLGQSLSAAKTRRPPPLPIRR